MHHYNVGNPRRVIATVLTVCLASAAGACTHPPASESKAALPGAGGTAVLPRPTGPSAVGRTTLHLVDKTRRDPWTPAAAARELMVSLYYPARPGTGGPAAPYMTIQEARLLLQRKAPKAAGAANTISRLATHARSDAEPASGRFPMVLLSPGFTLPRTTLTGLSEDLASRGYVVVAMDHTYETAGVTFPDGRTLGCAAICDRPSSGGPAAVVRSRVTDVSFVLDQLTGSHPAWRNTRMIDTALIGMAGHSLGGAAATAAMTADDRIRVGVNMDGTFRSPLSSRGLNRPFLLLGTQTGHAPGKDHTWDRDWPRLRGWKRWLTVTGSDHNTFTDLPILEQLLGRPGNAVVAQRAQQITRAYIAAFLDQHLKRAHQTLLDRQSPAYPEVTRQHP
ncbi:alpha/beta hydrolase family protein [Actinomadura kijaniata]|uniref:alpha/beta hydrolase family protein n=1 Tax=Actinomadura kijaniata TaxID=46161 RepID=UPI003F1A8FE0